MSSARARRRPPSRARHDPELAVRRARPRPPGPAVASATGRYAVFHGGAAPPEQRASLAGRVLEWTLVAMLSIRNGLVIAGCVCVGYVTSAGPGLVARAAEPPRWAELTARSEAGAELQDVGEARQRIARLEQRLRELEAERRAAPAGASGELEAALVQNRELRARNRELAAQNHALAERQAFEAPAGAPRCEPPGDADPRAHIRYWVEQLRGGRGFRGRLSTEQSAAVQALLRPERALDPQNPWRDAGAAAGRPGARRAPLASVE